MWKETINDSLDNIKINFSMVFIGLKENPEWSQQNKKKFEILKQ